MYFALGGVYVLGAAFLLAVFWMASDDSYHFRRNILWVVLWPLWVPLWFVIVIIAFVTLWF